MYNQARGVIMDRPTDNQTKFLGTYFDRDAALRFAAFAGLLAWILLGFYVYTTLISIGQFWWAVTYGGASYVGVNIFDRLSIPTVQISQLSPGLVYFTTLKIAQYALLILLDVEDNSRRAARK
jgi:hypothetical protein